MKCLAPMLFFFFLFISCNEKVDYYKAPSFSNTGGVNAVIEIPTGPRPSTNAKVSLKQLDCRLSKKQNLLNLLNSYMTFRWLFVVT